MLKYTCTSFIFIFRSFIPSVCVCLCMVGFRVRDAPCIAKQGIFTIDKQK